MSPSANIDSYYYSLVKPVEGKPYKEIDLGGDKFLRIFPEDTPEESLKWHWDEEYREVYPLNSSNWQFQFDNKLPQPINNVIKIPEGEFHRVIKGTGELMILIYKH